MSKANRGVYFLNEQLNRRGTKKIAAKEKITATAIALFTQRGLAETSVAAIMKHADLGTGTFYNYFESKEHLLNQFIHEKIIEAKISMEALIEVTHSPSEKLSKILLVVGQIFEDNKPLIMLFNALHKTNAVNESPGNHGQIFRDTFLKIIKEGQVQGEITPLIPPGMILETIHGILLSALTSTNSNLPITANLTYKITLLFQGISNKGGH